MSGKTETFFLELVSEIPERLEHGRIYVSYTYKTAIHLCACGCGNQSVTPFSEDGWKLSADDDRLVTLEPSILNTNCPNRAHYWIKNSCVRWAE